jgi:group I intron endonuclease
MEYTACIYVITNNTNGKQYVGQTTKTPEKRFKQHIQEAHSTVKGSRALNKAILKYGNNAFNYQVLHQNIKDSETLDILEQEYIVKHNTLVPNGYNIQIGGQSTGRKHCEESRKLMREKKLGENNPNFGKPRSEKTKLNISIAKSGEKHHFYGKTLDEQHKLKLSASHKKYQIDLPMYIGYIKKRTPNSSCEGYVVIHPVTKKKKHYTSSKFSMEEKLQLAKEHLEVCKTEICTI